MLFSKINKIVTTLGLFALLLSGISLGFVGVEVEADNSLS